MKSVKTSCHFFFENDIVSGSDHLASIDLVLDLVGEGDVHPGSFKGRVLDALCHGTHGVGCPLSWYFMVLYMATPKTAFGVGRGGRGHAMGTLCDVAWTIQGGAVRAWDCETQQCTTSLSAGHPASLFSPMPGHSGSCRLASRPMRRGYMPRRTVTAPCACGIPGRARSSVLRSLVIRAGSVRVCLCVHLGRHGPGPFLCKAVRVPQVVANSWLCRRAGLESMMRIMCRGDHAHRRQAVSDHAVPYFD